MFGSGTYTGWRAARWLDPVLDAKDRTEAVSRTIGGYSTMSKRDLNKELFGRVTPTTDRPPPQSSPRSEPE